MSSDLSYIPRFVRHNMFVSLVVAGGLIVVVVVALIRGVGFEVAGLSFNPTRQDVISVKDTAQLIRQDASQRGILTSASSR